MISTTNRYILLILLMILLQQNLFAQDSTQTDTTSQKTPFIDVGLKKPKLTPFLAPFYAPETQLMFAVGGLFTFSLRPLDPYIQRSSIPFAIGYSTNNSFHTNFRPSIYGIGGHYNLTGEIWIRNQPDHYYGVGYDNGKDTELGDSTTLYDRFWWQVKLNFVRTFKKHFQAGVVLDLNKTTGTDLNPRMAMDPDVIRTGNEVRNTGAGFVVQYDSRDLSVNAYEGMFISFSSVFYGEFLGGNHRYQIYELDYRQYHQIKREGRTLAWWIRTRIGSDNVPWPELSQLGNPFDFRGYRWGRYRDAAMLYGMMEYRHMFIRKKPNKKGSLKSRSGFVTWLGIGSIAPEFQELKDWLPNAGIGYRFEIQPRMNIRVDFGVGNNSTGFYVNVNEAF